MGGAVPVADNDQVHGAAVNDIDFKTRVVGGSRATHCSSANRRARQAMNISDKRRQELYDAIFQQVMDLRVKLRTGSLNPDEQLDYQLAQLIEKIWNDQKRVLGIIG